MVDRPTLLGMLVCAREVQRGGQLPFMPRPVVLELDSTQRRALRGAFGVKLDQWVLDSDAIGAKYAEDWSKVDASMLVGRRCEILVGDTTPTDTTRVPIHLAARNAPDAFGTGRHPTTRMVLEHIERHVSAGDAVIDVGTGSGVLAIAAARLGAASVRAFDLDRDAARLARANVALNGLASTVTVRASALRARAASADLVVANLIAGGVIRLMPALTRVLRPAGVLVVSGIVTTREDNVVDAASAEGLEARTVEREGSWTSLVLARTIRHVGVGSLDR